MGLFSWLFGDERCAAVPKEREVRTEDHSSRHVGSQIVLESCAQEEKDLLLQMLHEAVAPQEPRQRKEVLRKAVGETQASVRVEKEKLQSEERARRERGRSSDIRYSIVTDNFRRVWAAVERQKSFGRMLMRYVNERCDGRASVCYQRAGVSRQLYSQIISDLTKKVSKRTALQLCIGLKLDRSQAEQFLSFAGYSLSPSSFEDTAFAWCFEHGVYSIFDVNEFLVLGGCAPLSIN